MNVCTIAERIYVHCKRANVNSFILLYMFIVDNLYGILSKFLALSLYLLKHKKWGQHVKLCTNIMKPNKKGQIVRFHTPNPDENPDQLYVVLEIHTDVENPRAQIKALNTGLSFPSLNTVLVDDLEVVDVNTSDLIGHHVTIKKSDYSEVEGKVTNVREQKIMLDLTKGVKGVETNVWVTVIDNNGKEHTGTLFVC